jgi:hypothetical protein
MSPRALALTAGAVVILGGLIYLFVQVQADPVPSSAAAIDPGPAAGAERRPVTVATAPAPAAEPTRGPEESRPTGAVARQERVATAAAPVAPVAPAPDLDVDFEAAMDEANKHYDQGDYEAAYKQAVANLGRDPESIRSLRVAVASACMMGDADAARKYHANLPARDQRDMVKKCAAAHIELTVTAPSDDRRELVRKRAGAP